MSEKIDYGIELYYKKLNEEKKGRFDRIVTSIVKNFDLKKSKNPLETLLARQIALNTIRIEEAELDIIDQKFAKYGDKIEKWLFSAQKERRDAMTTLSNLLKAVGIKGKKDSYFNLRDDLREDEGLGKSENNQVNPDGHDRRYHDGVSRTEA